MTTTEEQLAEAIALHDLDGNLADFDESMAKHLEALRAPTEDPKLDETAFEDVPHMKARRHLIKGTPGFWRNLKKLQPGFDLLALTDELKFTNHILSKSPRKFPLAAAEKVSWCIENVPGVPITLSEDKGLMYGKVLCDDWVPYVKRWITWRPRGLVISVAQRWNEDIEKLSPNIIRYKSIHQLPDIRARLMEIRAKCRP